MKDFTMKYDMIQKTTFKGHLSFVCPECHCINTMKCKINNSISSPIPEQFSLDSIFIKITCSSCGFVFFEEMYSGLDPEIAPHIVELNRKGYKTRFSCQGHDDDQHGIDAYVFFTDFLDENLLKILPSCWISEESRKIDDDDEDTNEGTIIRCNDSNISLRERMESLMDWITLLPDNPNKHGCNDYTTNYCIDKK